MEACIGAYFEISELIKESSGLENVSRILGISPSMFSTDRGAETEQLSGDKLRRLKNPPPGTPERPLEGFRGVRGVRQSLKRGFAVWEQSYGPGSGN